MKESLLPRLGSLREKDALLSPPGTPGSPGRSVSQTRLDQTTTPVDAYSHSYLRWRRKLRDPTLFPASLCLARLAELEAMLPILQADLNHPPSTWTGEQWTAALTRRQRLAGQRAALEEILGQERRAPRTPEAFVGWDPFAGE